MRRSDVIAALLICLALLCAAWIFGSRTDFAHTVGPAFSEIFLTFALVLAPLVWFGFGAAQALRPRLSSRIARIIVAALFGLPYLIASLATGTFVPWIGATFFLLPVVLAVLFETCSESRVLVWQDVVALAALAVPIIFHMLTRGWPQAGFPKILLADVALFIYLVIRRLPGIGYDFHPQLNDLAVGAREWIFFAPIVIALGLALGFLHWHPRIPSLLEVVGGLAFTLVFIAIPEELFFRGLLLNLLETRLPQLTSLLISAALFGLSHFNKRATFNWRYVLLATISGIFYGRAWRNRRRILTSAITHTLVDVCWSIWFH